MGQGRGYYGYMMAARPGDQPMNIAQDFAAVTIITLDLIVLGIDIDYYSVTSSAS